VTHELRAHFAESALDTARSLLESVRGRTLERAERGSLAEGLAAALLGASHTFVLAEEQKRQDMLARLVGDAYGQALTNALTDRVFRSSDPRRVVDQLRHLCGRFGTPQYMPALARAQLSAARWVGGALPELTAQAVLARVRSEARSVLLSAEAPALSAFLASRRREGVRVNVNQLGEALLGEREAEARVDKYVALAEAGEIDALSVKVSSIGSQLNLLAFEATAQTLARRLARIYAATLQRGVAERPIVMLDMEAYDDVELTFEVLRTALDTPRFSGVRAGVVLQAYLPDSNALLERACQLSAARVERAAQPLRLRLVKGANLAHERVESAKTGLPLPIFASKREVDANYKRLLERAVPYLRDGQVELGVASHNLFDVAYALLLRAEQQVFARLGIEMLEGMANATVRALRALEIDVLVYAPVCSDDAMSSGIAYLVRRLDENTAKDNFLRNSFGMQPGDAAFERERLRFREALASIDTLDTAPRRGASTHPPDRAPTHPPDRTSTNAPGRASTNAPDKASSEPSSEARFRGEPDTDFARADARAAIAAALAERERSPATVIASIVAGQVAPQRGLRDAADPSRPGVVPYRVALADAADVERALDCAERDVAGFSRSPPSERVALLGRIARLLRERRAELISALVMDGGKRVVEADAEVSEAIDFAEYYRASYLAWLARAPVELSPRGTVLVTPPWNFPLAIAAGGTLAALVTGNRVILKPALETAFVGQLLAELLWQAGVPRGALSLLLCEDDVASLLIADRRVNSVVLTGATDTARLFQRMRPGLHLLAETGGKNAYIVTAMSDRELAIRDVVQSAFGHAGQKCSACSLLILEAEVYDDPHFRDTLRDAVESLAVGSAWDARSFVTPLIQPPSGPLLRALRELEPHEQWLVEPHVSPDNPHLLSPGVKLGVRAGSFTHETELFGPLLGVMRAVSLKHAIALANASGYGLTAGLASLDEREQTAFIEKIAAGNVYVNRTITGAIVARQPFGGYGKSGFGPGAKAGGPNYVVQLCRPYATGEPSARAAALDEPSARRLLALCSLLDSAESERLRRYVADYAHAHSAHFARTHDFAQLLGQDNLFRYRPADDLVLRVEAGATLFELAASCMAAGLAGAQLDVSLDPKFGGAQLPGRTGLALRVESLAQLSARLQRAGRIRLLGTRTPQLDALASQLGAHVADAPVLPAGCLELLHYLREQSISIDYHRYGNLGIRGIIAEQRERTG
jgi:RHH-type proline utilization regulon transcriptional repressor/proline dehydrogenase/delta 1-pyrroline-5-carboxylate dehydrogenase